MNMVICTSRSGTRSRCAPTSRSRGSVVDASRIEAVTPSVALARMFQAAQRPGTLSESPSTSVRSPSPMTGMRKANSTNGSSITMRRRMCPGGIRATAATLASMTAYRPKAQNHSRGVATITRAKASTASSLHCGGSRCTGEAPGRYSRRPALISDLLLGPAAPAHRVGDGGGDEQGDGDADHAGDAHRDAAHLAVVAQREVAEQVVRRTVGEALLLGDRLQPVGVGGGERR